MTRFEDTLRKRVPIVVPMLHSLADAPHYAVTHPERDAIVDALAALRDLVASGEVTEQGVLMRDIGAATDAQIALARLDAGVKDYDGTCLACDEYTNDDYAVLLAEVERLREERDVLKHAADTADAIAAARLDKMEQLQEERDRLADALERWVAAAETNSEAGAPDYAHAALSSLPEQEDGPQAEAGGGQGRRSGEGPH